ncbi:hypothetical protein B0T13DRAFT_509019 [Neurospora crassa]|nr:hypothetical protein B0T13DRAFT_509019 [Neurospora crassa]
MDPNNTHAPLQRFITSAAQFHQIQQEAMAAALQGANAARCADFPRGDAEKLVLIDELLAAMTNTAGLVDNVGNNPDENGNVKAIRNMPRERQEEMAWTWLYRLRDIQLGIRNPDIFTPEFPNFMSRFRAFVSFVRSTKAGVTDMFAASYMDRYIGNPVAELDTKVSNNYTNKLKIYNFELRGARDNGRTVIENGNIAEVRDASGNLVKTVIKPLKRSLSDFLDGELPVDVARPRRAPRSRTATGSSAASVATTNTTGVEAQHAPFQGAAAVALPAIQEEDVASNPLQANQSKVTGHTDQLESEQSNLSQQSTIRQNIEQSDIEQSDIEQSTVYQPNIYQQNIEESRFGQQNTDHPHVEQPNFDRHGAGHVHARQYNADRYHGPHAYHSQYPVSHQYGAEAYGARQGQAPADPASAPLAPSGPSLGDLENRNGGSQAGSTRTEYNRPGRLVQNAAGATWWVQDNSSDESE